MGDGVIGWWSRRLHVHGKEVATVTLKILA
jgi:hypothetical protein